LAEGGYGRLSRVDPGSTGTAWSICAPCYREKLRCATCGVRVGAKAFMLEGDSRLYCHYCFEQCPRCDTCDRPIGKEHSSGGSRRTLCRQCESTVVSDPVQAYALYSRVRTTLVRRLGMTMRDNCHLKLVGRKQLLSIVEKSSLHSLDADSRGRCFGLFLRQGRQRSIYIEHNLPQIVLLEVMAHEYAHAWQSEHCLGTLSAEVQEGFAEWTAYKLLEHWGCSRRAERLLRRDDLYGRGLKLVLGWEAQGGEAEVFHRMHAAT
jgi:hypothetical protein